MKQQQDWKGEDPELPFVVAEKRQFVAMSAAVSAVGYGGMGVMLLRSNFDEPVGAVLYAAIGVAAVAQIVRMLVYRLDVSWDSVLLREPWGVRRIPAHEVTAVAVAQRKWPRRDYGMRVTVLGAGRSGAQKMSFVVPKGTDEAVARAVLRMAPPGTPLSRPGGGPVSRR